MYGPLDLLTAFKAVIDSGDVAYMLSSELRILRTNAAWDQFARDNGGEHLQGRGARGASVLDAVPEPLKTFYQGGFAMASKHGERWDHDYECSSPEVFRRFRMLVYPFGGSFLVTHSLLVARSHDVAPMPAGSGYVKDGIVVMCSHCRRVRSERAGPRWDWVPQYVAVPPVLVSHGLCPVCLAYYYPEDV